MKRSRKQIMLSIRKNWQLYLFLLVPVVYVIVFKYVPMGGVIIAFKDFKMRQGIWGSDWVGLEHFIRFINTYQFGKVVKNTLILSLYSIAAGFPIPIIFALMMNCLKNERIKKFVQSITCLPHFISTVVMVGIVFQLFNPRTGLYGIISEALRNILCNVRTIVSYKDSFSIVIGTCGGQMMVRRKRIVFYVQSAVVQSM